MTLAAHALTIVDTLRDDLCVSTTELPEPRAERLIDRASREFMRIAGGRDFHRGTGLVHDVEGYGTPEIIAPRAPISTLTSVALLDAGDGTVSSTYDATSYRVSDANAGLIFRSVGWPWTTQRGSGIRGGGVPGYEAKLLRITYNAGWITPHQATPAGGSVGTRDLPEDIETAVLMAAGSLFLSSGRDRSVSREQLGKASVTYRDSSSMQGGLPGSWMPPEAVSVAISYRRYYS